MDGGYEAELLAAWDKYADTRLGPAIRDDAKRFCPVDTGNLRDSIENHMETDHTLIVSATGGAGGRTYAAYLPRARAPRLPSIDRRYGPGNRTPRAFLEAGAFYAA